MLGLKCDAGHFLYACWTIVSKGDTFYDCPKSSSTNAETKIFGTSMCMHYTFGSLLLFFSKVSAHTRYIIFLTKYSEAYSSTWIPMFQQFPDASLELCAVLLTALLRTRLKPNVDTFIKHGSFGSVGAGDAFLFLPQACFDHFLHDALYEYDVYHVRWHHSQRSTASTRSLLSGAQCLLTVALYEVQCIAQYQV